MSMNRTTPMTDVVTVQGFYHADIIRTTERAVLLREYDGAHEAWFPRAAVIPNSNGTGYTVARWFALTPRHERALGMLS